MNKKALITGIGGSGPSYLAEYLTTLPNLEVSGISRWHTDSSNGNLKNIKDKVKLYTCDLTDMGSVIRTLEDVQPDYIFNMAAIANVRMCFEYPSAIFRNNVDSTLNLLEAVRVLKMKPIIHHCSTSEVYGQVKPEDVPIKETHKIDPINVYAISKFAQEKLMRSYYLSYGIPVVLTRSFTYINPRRPDIFSSAFARQVVEIEKGKRDKLVYGNLESVRSIIDVRDIVEAYWIAVNNCDYGEDYNIGVEKSVTVGEFLDILLSNAKVKINHEQDSKLLRPVDVTLQIPDVSKFENKTGWIPKYTLEDSINFLLDYYRNII
jgi:GDPmannose 4,6-dehydratase/GDP-4-dehydro-6-deoxy-D-mannose reductase